MKTFIHYFKLMCIQAKNSEYHGVLSQLFEMTIVFIRCRVGPGYYQMADMGRKKFDWKYKLGFLNGKSYIKRVDTINDPLYYSTTYNKVVEKCLFTLFSIPTPKVLGFLHVDRGHFFGENNLRTLEDLTSLCLKNINKKVCIKPVSGFGGEGFRLVEIHQHSNTLFLYCLKDHKEIPIDEYFNSLNLKETDGFLVEEHFKQHNVLSKLNPTSLNTLRIMIYKPDNQPATCLGAFLKLGRNGSIVDNGAAGGIISKVNLDTGTLEPAMIVSSRYETYNNHPDSDEIINGTPIPFLNDAIELAKKSLEPFPGIRHIGADIAIGPQGPAVIELNARADYVDYAILNVPSKLALS